MRKLITVSVLVSMSLALGAAALAADTACHGAQGDKATPAGSKGGVPLPAARTCLNPAVQRLLDGNSEDFAAGMAVDSQGHAILAGETKSFDDTTYGDLFVAKLKPTGEIAWMLTYGGAKDDGIHPHDENTEGDGQEAMVDVDEKDHIYVVGRGKSHGDIYGGIAMKLSPDGKLVWSRVYRPEWANRGNTAAEFHALDYHKDVLHVVGVTEGESKALLVALDAATGALLARAALDPTPGSNDRLYAVAVDPSGEAVYAGGWVGSGQGSLMRFAFRDNKYSLTWARLVPLPRGSNIVSLDLDGQGGLYAVADIHGAKTHSEVHRYDVESGKLMWVRRYNQGVANDKTQTHVVRVVGNDLLLGGKIGFTGTYTHVDSFGDGFLLRLDRDGNLKEERYFFTGTDPKSFDTVKAVGLFGKDLYVVGNHFGVAMVGEWRNPADYSEIQHAWTEADRREYMLKSVEPALDTNAKPTELKDGKELVEYKLNPDAGEYAYSEPITKDSKQRSAQIYFWIFKDYL